MIILTRDSREGDRNAFNYLDFSLSTTVTRTYMILSYDTIIFCIRNTSLQITWRTCKAYRANFTPLNDFIEDEYLEISCTRII